MYSYIIAENLATRLHWSTRETGRCNPIMCPGMRSGWIVVGCQLFSHSLQFWLPSFCVYTSHTYPFSNLDTGHTPSFREANQKFHPILESSSDPTIPEWCSVLSLRSWCGSGGSGWISVDWIIKTLIQKREEWETQQSLFHSTDGDLLGRGLTVLRSGRGQSFSVGPCFCSSVFGGPMLCPMEGTSLSINLLGHI